jgi:hypothetical protein
MDIDNIVVTFVERRRAFSNCAASQNEPMLTPTPMVFGIKPTIDRGCVTQPNFTNFWKQRHRGNIE